MASTTQILFNSPALHALKRDQLVKLCKIHSIKASGKNVDLIHKLKTHAQSLPKDSPLSVAARSELPLADDFGSDTTAAEGELHSDGDISRSAKFQAPRPSEQWEVVMDSIDEQEEGSSNGTVSSRETLAGEFGTAGSKSSSVGSSIKALASSFGFRRMNSTKSAPHARHAHDELAQNSFPYSSLPVAKALPQTDHISCSPSRPYSEIDEGDTPLPGHALRPGVPAPINARLSLGFGLGAPSTPTRKTQPTTTIRLISNTTHDIHRQSGTPQLKPFATTFDILLGSPGPVGKGLSTWPLRDADAGIYPTLSIDDLPPEMDKPTPQARTFPHTPTTSSLQPKPSPQPFIFGSPLPQNNVSNDQFRSAAASVLEEMNKRLGNEGVQGVDLDIVKKLQPGAHSQENLNISRDYNPLPMKRGGLKEKFEKLHDAEFDRMEGIDILVKRRAERSPIKEAGEEQDRRPIVGQKRKSSVVGRDRDGRRIPGAVAGRASNARVISNGRRPRPRVLPGAFDEDEDEEDQEQELHRGEKKMRFDTDPGQDVVSQEKEAALKEQELEEARQKAREREAIRRKLEISRAKRRSSVATGLHGRRSGRVSVGRGGLVSLKPIAKSTRFGFLSSAKSIVQSVWNKGKTTATSSNIPKPNSSQLPIKDQPAPLVSAQKRTLAPTREVSLSGPGNNSLIAKSAEREAPSVSSRARSPLPTFTPSSVSTHITGTGTSSRMSTINSFGGLRQTSFCQTNVMMGSKGTASRLNPSGPSSIGTHKSSIRSSTSTPTVSSMGTRRLFDTPSRKTSTIPSSRIPSTSSRLLAPTASSLAKMNRVSVPGMTAVAGERAKNVQLTIREKENANALKSCGSLSPPRAIFKRPLDLVSGIPSPVKRTASTVDDERAAGSLDVNRQRSLSGRKPRISRSKVIARLVSQRAAGTGLQGRPSEGAPRNGGRTRSSFGAKVQRTSMVTGGRGSGGGAVLMSAKKRARQSEYLRRRSRAGAAAGMGTDSQMEVVES